MEYLYPYIDGVQNTGALKTQKKDVKWDFEKNIPVYDENNEPVFVYGIEAVKSWAWRALMTERCVHPIFSREYGSEVKTLFGRGYTSETVKSEAQRIVAECLKQNSDIVSVENFEVDLEKDVLKIKFRMITIYGEEEIAIEY